MIDHKKMIDIEIINPENGEILHKNKDLMYDQSGNEFYEANGILSFVDKKNYTENFGYQWNKFEKIQLDRIAGLIDQSKARFFAETEWPVNGLANENVLEVGSGAGRFSQVVLEHTKADLYSIDYSSAVEANYRNNGHFRERFKLFQASIYGLPFAENSFDKVFCFGVIQHTPDVEKSVEALVKMVRPGGELIVDFYPIKGWYTKIHAKYFFRPITKRMGHARLLELIEKNNNWMINGYQFFDRMGIGRFINRFIPICDIKNTLPKNLSLKELREWAILDTFDMLSPQYDQPQKIETVKNWFIKYRMKVIFAGFINYQSENTVAVVRGIRI